MGKENKTGVITHREFLFTFLKIELNLGIINIS